MAIVAASDLPFGQCRCCLNFGYHKHISKPYYTNGIRQIYQDIFLECFNLLLSKNTELTDLICKACIRQLVDASEFKSMVVESERILISDLGGSDEKVGTEEATTHKMNASSPCHCSDCNPTDHNYARPQQETKNAYFASLRPRKAVKKIPDDDPIKLASESPEDDQTDSDWHASNSGDDNKKTHRKTKQDDVKEGDLKKYTNEDIRLESMLKYSCTLCKLDRKASNCLKNSSKSELGVLYTGC
ncbi:zinc-finger associated domain (zf-AD) domain-containing protein [Phthorimaea operculella]|nr:zinc-finger associated domain (zf-AD) domain-containing protein [Phthorimaea operculella]